jgi:hypothetical protein
MRQVEKKEHKMAQIIVSGYMIRHPVTGNVWAFFHYVLRLHLLGHKVIYQ